MGLAPKICQIDGCPRIVERGVRCDRHPEKRSPSSKLTSAPGYKKIRAEVLERDKGICHICGLPGADTADHVTAAAHGGENTHAGLAAAHRTCNRRKSDGL